MKRFGTLTALDGIDLVLQPSELVGLLGPNGAGKSTLLRILGTTLIPDAGEVSIDGGDVVANPALGRRSVGLVLGDERSFYWRLTGTQNLEFFAALQGFSRREAAARTRELLVQFDLRDGADRRVSDYSSGMRARLSLCRALLTTPKVLLLDEPSKSLDPMASLRFRQFVQDLVADHGITALFATHDLHEAAALAGRIVVLVRGHIVKTQPSGATAADLEDFLVREVER